MNFAETNEITVMEDLKNSLGIYKIALLGTAQIILWGGSYFLLSVISSAIISETGWSSQMIYGCLSLSLFTAGLLLPKIGKIIQTNNRNLILPNAGFIIATGLVIIGSASSFYLFCSGWIIIGIGMAMGLYDPLFAAVGKKYGRKASKPIVWITLLSSLAPSFCWPFSSFLLHHFGWRNTCFICALILAVTIYPIHWHVFKSNRIENQNKLDNGKTDSVEYSFQPKLFYLILINFTIGAAITTSLIIHLIDILSSKRINMPVILTAVAFLGPSQSLARVLEIVLGKKNAIEISFVSVICMLAGLLLILYGKTAIIPGIVLFGIGNGLRSVLRGALPLSIYGQENYALIIGRLGRLPMIFQAFAPLVGGFIIQYWSANIFLLLITALAVLNAMVIMAIKKETYNLNYLTTK